MSQPPPPESPYQGPQAEVGHERPLGFGERLLGLPFSRSLWRRAARLGLPEVALPLAVLCMLASLALGAWLAPGLQDGLRQIGDHYDAHADPLVFENGRFRLDGNRTWLWANGDLTVLFDPEITQAAADIATTQFVIVRAEEVIVQQQGAAREHHPAQRFSDMLGPGPIVIDGSAFREAADRYVMPVVLTLAGTVGTGFQFIACLFYAAIAGFVLQRLRGQRLGLDFAACYNVALATSAATLVAEWLLIVAGVGAGIPGLVLWPAVMTALGLWALAESEHGQTPAVLE